MITAIVFDLHGVLIHSAETKESQEPFHERVGLEQAAWRQIADCYLEEERTWDRVERGEISLHDFGVELGSRIGRAGGTCTPEIAATIWGDPTPFGRHPNRLLNKEMMQVLKSLPRHLKKAIFTNNIPEWRPVWTGVLPEDVVFDEIFDSSQIGARKPERASYEYVQKTLRAEASAILFIDDRFENIQAANKRGWRSHWFVGIPSLQRVLQELKIDQD